MMQMDQDLELIYDHEKVKERVHNIVGSDTEKYGKIMAALETEWLKGEEIFLVFKKNSTLKVFKFTKHGDVELQKEEEIWWEPTYTVINKVLDKLRITRPDLSFI